MNVLGTIRLSAIFHFAAVETVAAILLCYGLAVAYGHVKPWLPMISDCAVYPPEKYPFRFGIALGSLLMGAQVVMLHLVKNYSRISLGFGLLGAAALGVVAVVNEEENNSIHSGNLSYSIVKIITRKKHA